MIERGDEAALSAILKATADPTRRRILTLLVQEGPMRVTDLAAHFEMSLAAVSKHIQTLEGAGLVTRSRAWREHVIRADLGSLTEIERWFKALRWVWETRLEKFAAVMEQENRDDDED